MLQRAQILSALSRLAELLRNEGIEGELCLLGGTVMVLAFDARPSAKDVDAIFEPVAAIRRLAGAVASELELPEVPPRTQFLLEELLDEIAQEAE